MTIPDAAETIQRRQVKKIITLSGHEIELAKDALDNLQMLLRGPVFVPGDAGYEDSRTVWNAMIDRQPAFVVRCIGRADVIHCVRFAREHDLLLCIKGGGHNIAGLTLGGGFGYLTRRWGWTADNVAGIGFTLYPVGS